MTSQPLLAGRYELGQRLGKGGMGEVWRGRDTVLRRDVAIKTVDLSAAEDAATRERFQREAHATASLSHPNVVTVFDAGIDGSRAYLVMELLSGPTLSALVSARGALTTDEVIDYAQQTAAALEAAHRVGIVHRDIKPGNLMLDQTGRLKVLDFGIARLTQTGAARLTATDTTLGSAAYMAPEQARGEPASESTDTYALGCVLMTLLTGEPPFVAEHPMAVMHKQLNSPAPRVRERRFDVPAALDRLVADMLTKDATERPSDAGVLAALGDLQRGHIGGETAILTAPLVTPQAGTGEASTPPGNTKVDGARRQALSRVGWLVAGSLAAAAALIWLVVSLTGNEEPTDATGSTGTVFRPSATPGERATPDQDSSETSATPQPPEPDTEGMSAAIAAVRVAVESSIGEGLRGHQSDKVLKDLDKLDVSLASGDRERLSHDLDQVEKSVNHAADKGEISSSGRQRIEAAISAAREQMVAK